MAALTFDAALNRLKRLAAADVDPKLSPSDLVDILEASRSRDRFGVLPIITGWESTYDMNRAAAEAWDTKAAKAAGDHDFSADGASYSASQVVKHCREQASMYRMRMVSSSGGNAHGHGQVVNG